MNGNDIHNPGRRSFLTKVVPACALTCLAANHLVAMPLPGTDEETKDAVHNFDAELKRKLTYRQYFGNQYREYIELAKALEKKLGKNETLEFLKEVTAEKMTGYGKRQAEGSPDNSFATWVKQFREGYENVLTKEIVIDTDTVFELKVTECIWADTFLRANAGEIGYAAVCWGDYAWPTAFNSKITMVRDKTLMEGDKICNHRYLWEA